ncbi:dipeptide ABC transporter ATP-binding protein [Brevibacillus laterosporus]|uniref:ABC transporter ATP-binding protein n=1 Tax=Brevibacillus laterosporus TaxID=1465 RepID=UPI00047784E4|nr:dipeptide ABC transporter ATP-binding protein [Brevibacillus laterosporus]ATO50687.1 dipeptide/oligopeptide/nickel ABC transporter ATP-binding protein [Brevibacillus laterosporus DSM 25]MBG9804626.1 peptide ABC transporter ATPase [Brevibacillus laterosporus]MED2002888.1 dipeptide ABC transporter ATP-binding protein [Brevibacillus laterosporus]MED4764923.1 dipeptide ABC transporter ATP-binding protein [Brevibacillus laterosporus]
MVEDLLVVNRLKKYYPITGGVFAKEIGAVKAVDDVSFHVKRGETLGLVGESGCGKSTTGRSILRLIEPTSGEVLFEGKDVARMKREEVREIRKDMQIIFQDPFASLNPRHTVGKILEEPLIVHGVNSSKERSKRVHELLEVVGLSTYHVGRYPHQFSGGQRQRIGIARALILNPKLIVADEPVSALDVSVQSQVLNLMQDLQKEYNLTYLFIAHDLSVVRHISDRVGVMYLGRIAEIADKDELYANPHHPYTKALLSAVPVADPDKKQERIILQGDLPSPANPPSGCTFHTRCPHVMDVCREKRPEMLKLREDHLVACHLYS